MYLKCLYCVLLECSLCITNGCINRGHSLDLRTVLLSISGLYPFITMILGILMSRQHTNWQNEKAKDRFIESEQRFVRIMNNINMFFFNLDLNGNFVSFNRYLLKNTGYSEEELIGKSAVDIFVPDDEKQKAKNLVAELLQHKKDVYYHEGKIRTKDNEILHVLSRIMLAKDKQGQLKGISVLSENVTGKNAIIAKLKEAKEKAEESNRLKSVFLQNVSHEIRTPMNAIIGFISLLKDSPVDEETRYQFYEIINKGGERLIATVNDLIDISQIETQQIKVNKTAFSISELLSTLLYGSTFFFNIPKDEIVADKAETNTPEDKEKRLKQYSKILVAEDDEMNYLFLKNLLEHKGFGIVHAWNGEEAVEMLRNDDDISLVLMDIKMPVMSGEEATRQIRTFNQDIPIIAQTAYAMPSDRSKLLEIGCNDYISKPIVTDSLVKLLQKHVNPSG